ncbi:MAG: GMP/IMP nucleotidase [Pontibacterium sp.]
MLNWSRINTVLLDMDGTLLDLHFDSYFWLEYLPLHYAQVNNLPPVQARDWLHQRIIKEQGSLNWYCLDYWSKELNINIAKLKREVADRIAFRPFTVDFLAWLQRQNKRVVIVTNAHQDSFNLKHEITAIGEHVDNVICSHDFGLPKEDPKFWEQLQAQEPFDKQHTLLVDDSISVLKSAEAYGIEHLVSIIQPDSQAERREIDGFMAIDHFDEIVPSLNKP